MSVISRMLKDLESRGAGVPVSRPAVPAWVADSDQAALASQGFGSTPAAASPKAWARTPMVLLLGALLVGGAAYGLRDGAWPPEVQALHASSMHSGTPAKPAKPNVVGPAISTWRMDWTLSLGLLKPRMAASSEKSRSPDKADVGEATMDVAPRAEFEPAHVQAAASQPAMQIAIIDAPAAGRVQSSANQAIEAYRRAMDLAEQGRDSVALEAALRAVKLDAQHMPARRLAIALALDQKQVDQAGALIDEGLQLAPHDSEMLFLHARRLALAGANEQALSVLQGLDRVTGETLGLKAGLLARTGQYAAAVPAYQQALKSRPDNATWWLGLGVALNAQGQGAMAKEAFLRARKLGQLSPDVQAWLDQQL